MLSQTWDVNTQPIDDLIQFMDSFDDLVLELGEEVFASHEQALADELQYYPPPIPDSKYVRTFKLRNGWKIHLQRTGEGFVVVIETGVSYARYVVGSLAQSLAAAKAFQARVHQGRWPLASETVSFWYEAFQEDFEQRFAEELAAFGSATISRRAVTPGRRRRRAAS